VDQTYPNWELCLADDGSDDAALTALLLKFSQRDSRIRVGALAQNRGISSATNEALRLSTAEYVAFLDHDDELAAFALSAVVQALMTIRIPSCSIPTRTKSTHRAAGTMLSSSPAGLRICSALATISATLW
jgi:glycosyltransferase involved in cell wall biosynthesis